MLNHSSTPWRTALAVFVLQVLATLAAIAFDWRTCFQASAAHEPVSNAFAASGSAISAPVMPLALLVAAGLLSRRNGRWGGAGAVGTCLVAALLAFGAVGEALSHPSSHTPEAVLVFSGAFGLAQAAALVIAALATRRARSARLPASAVAR